MTSGGYPELGEMTSDNPYDLPPTPTHPDDLGFTPSDEERNLAVIAHLSGMAGILVGGLIGFLGPLIIYLMNKDSSVYVESQAKEALNFQITILIVGVGCVALMVVSCGFLFPLVFVPMVLQFVFAIIAALAVKDGQHYRYPFNLRFLK
jgi:uncharacterized protein